MASIYCVGIPIVLWRIQGEPFVARWNLGKGALHCFLCWESRDLAQLTRLESRGSATVESPIKVAPSTDCIEKQGDHQAPWLVEVSSPLRQCQLVRSYVEVMTWRGCR